MGRAFVFGDDISTDLIAPGHLLKKPPEILAQSCMAAVNPDFVKTAKQGDIVVGGRNFGQGSSREQAIESFKLLGISVLLAKSFARIFYRNSFNLGMPALIFPDADEINEGDDLTLDIPSGRIENLSTGRTYTLPPLPQHLLDMLDAGGLIPQLERRFRSSGG